LTVSRATAAAERLRQVAQHYSLSEDQRKQLATIVSELSEDAHAPSAIRAPASVVDTHVADSLVALALPELQAAASIADIGSGAGFPGLPIAVALPGTHVWLVEGQARRCAFLRRICREALVANAEVVCLRAEEWDRGGSRCDVVLARAVASPAVVLEYAAPLLRIGGTLVDWRGDLDDSAREQALRAANDLGMETAGEHKVRPFPGASGRWLYLYLKVRATPERFPRRPGMARKRPLG
jgi:16S rRNA (guanine527-N7)-methyltransferase